ncbi:MAG: amino acid ABC transporter substrate-binding protein, partial [Oscillospiraceae bacterium]|nr:amino acid ABC transporter substrate-binding protein [Oscillospiraceae bacterium]
DAGKLVLGLDATFKPMGFTDENDQIVGFDIDVAEEVCSRMGIELELYSVNWDTKEQDLNAGTIDCIWNGLSVSEERKQMMLMSEPYMNNEMVFVVNGKSDITALSDLSDAKIGVQNGSTALEILNASEVVANGAVPVELATNVEALQQLELDMVDAVFLDSVVANYEIVSTGKDYKVLEEGLSSEEYAIGFRLGDQALCDEVTKTLKEMVADGKLAEISTEWFGSDVTTIGK